MHAVIGIAYRHRPHRVAMIGAAKGDEPGPARLALIAPVLNCHLERDFDRHRARIAKEHMLERGIGSGARKKSAQPVRQKPGRLVGQPAEHHMRHGPELAFHRREYMRVVIAVDGGPPGRDAVDQPAPVGETDAAAGCLYRLERGRFCLHLRIGPPEAGGPGLRH